MSDDGLDVTVAALQSVAGRSRRQLQWAALLLGVMLTILLIDLQLKKSIARQAVTAAGHLERADGLARGTDRLLADLKRGFSGRSSWEMDEPDADRPDAAGAGLGGDGAMAAGSGLEAGPLPGQARGSEGGPGDRPGGDG